MYYLWTVWSGCPHDIFSMVSFSIYILCNLSQNASLKSHEWTLPKISPISNYFSILLKEKRVKATLDLVRKRLHHRKYLEPHKYNPLQGRLSWIHYKVAMFDLVQASLLSDIQKDLHGNIMLLKMNSKKQYYSELFYIRILQFICRFLQGNIFTYSHRTLWKPRPSPNINCLNITANVQDSNFFFFWAWSFSGFSPLIIKLPQQCHLKSWFNSIIRRETKISAVTLNFILQTIPDSFPHSNFSSAALSTYFSLPRLLKHLCLNTHITLISNTYETCLLLFLPPWLLWGEDHLSFFVFQKMVI